jgi:ATP-dependent RNA helicase DDX19/DBP5
MAFQYPSKIQAIALPSLLDNPPSRLKLFSKYNYLNNFFILGNIIAQSQSGTGKTAAFSLAIISRIDPSIQSPQTLILAPTFELAIQIGSVIEKMAQFLPYIKIAYAVRDPTISKRSDRPRGQLLPEPIVIGTPGTVEEWCLKLRVIDLSRLRVCCVDEADVMIATQNFQQICIQVVRGLNLSACQMMLFSATYSDEVMGFAREIVPNPVVLRLKREKQTLVNIKQFFIRCYDQQHKYDAIEQIYAHVTVGQAMIFCRTKATARDLAIRLANQQHSVRELTAALDIEQRASVIKQFREGLFRVLISTNVTARGKFIFIIFF